MSSAYKSKSSAVRDGRGILSSGDRGEGDTGKGALMAVRVRALPEIRHDNEMNVFAVDVTRLSEPPQRGSDIIAITGGGDAAINVWGLAKVGEGAPTLRSKLVYHQGAVNAVKFSPNDRILEFASGAADATVAIWQSSPDGEDFRRKKTFRGHAMDVTCVSWHPNGELLASASVDNTCRVWDVDDGTCRTLRRHDGWVKACAFCPRGEILATFGDDGVLVVWDCRAWVHAATIHDLYTTQTFSRSLTWSPKGGHLCVTHAGGSGYNAAIFDRGRWIDPPLLLFHGHSDVVVCAAFSPRTYVRDEGGGPAIGVCAISCADGSLSIWAAGGSKPLLVVERLCLSYAIGLVWGADGLTMYACCADGQVRAVEVEEAVFGAVVPHVPEDSLVNAGGKGARRKKRRVTSAHQASYPIALPRRLVEASHGDLSAVVVSKSRVRIVWHRAKPFELALHAPIALLSARERTVLAFTCDGTMSAWDVAERQCIADRVPLPYVGHQLYHSITCSEWGKSSERESDEILSLAVIEDGILLVYVLPDISSGAFVGGAYVYYEEYRTWRLEFDAADVATDHVGGVLDAIKKKFDVYDL